MKPNRTNPLFARFFRGNTLVTAVVVSLAGLASQPSAQAGDLYWDTNVDAAGSGNAGGAWDSGTNWSTDASGAIATVGWINGENAIFSAGADGVTAKTVTLAGTISTPLIRLEDAGLVTLNGGSLDVTGGTTIDTSVLGGGGGGSLNWTPAIIGSGNLTLKVNGDISDTGAGSNTVFVLSGANTFTGNVRFTSGVTRLSSGFGDAANKLILDGGGIIDDNINITSARNIEVGAGGGIIRLWGGATTNLNGTISNEAGVLSATLKRTDGGTLRLNGSGANFTGTLINAQGNLYMVSQNWAGTDLVTTDGGNVVYFPTAGDTTIKSLTSDRDINIAAGARLNIATGVYNAVSPPTTNNFWMQGAGKLTSSSNTLTFNWGTSYEVAGDQSVRVIVEDYAPGVPLAVIKNGPGGLNNYDKANTYTGGTTINGGRVNASNAQSFGTGTVTVTPGGQAYITAGVTYANNFAINGLGCTENAGTLGAIRFQNNSISGNLSIVGDARIGGYNAFGNLTGALTGSANLEINSNDGNFSGTISFTGNTAGYTGNMTVTQGTLNVGVAGLGGGLIVQGGTAAALNNTFNRAGSTATVVGGIAGNLTVNGGTASADGAAAVASATGGTVTVNGAIGGNVMVNAGTAMTLNGGTATATAGTAILAGAVAGNVTVADGATLGGEGSVAGKLTLGGAAGATLRVNGLTTGALSVAELSMDPASVNTVALEALPSIPGPFVILDYTTLASGDDMNLVVPTNLYRGNPLVVHDTDNTRFTLELDSQTRTWNASESPDWNTTALNWDEGDNLFYAGDPVIFTDNGAGTVNLPGVVTPMSVTFANGTGNNFVLAGTGGIAGSTGINKVGLGDVNLGGANTFTGAVKVDVGVLTFGSGGALGQTSGVTVAAGTRVNLNGQGVGNTTNTTWTIVGDGGDGVGNLGAITNSGGEVYEDSSIKHLVLSGDAEIGGNNGRFDVGRDGVSGAGGSINGGGFTLNKVGTNAMVFRGPASNITYVLNAGSLTFEDYDTASGTNPITVNAGRLGTYNNRSIPNDVTFTAAGAFLVSQAANGTWTGTITLNGDTTFQTDGNLIIDGPLAGAGNITKQGGGTLVLQNAGAGYSGKVTLNGGVLRVENNAALGTYAGPDAIRIGNSTLQGGTIAAQASATIGSATQGITQTANVTYDAGAANTLTLGGLVTGTGNIVKANNSGTLVFDRGISTTGLVSANGGALLVNQGINLGGGFELGGTIVGTIAGTGGSIGAASSSGIHLWRSTLNISHTGTLDVWDIETQEGGGEKADINQTSGILNVAKDIRLGHWGNASAADFCTYNLSGGTINMPDTVTNPTAEDQANLFLGIDGTGVLNQSGGTINTTSMVVDGRGDTAGNDIYRMTGGRLNMGKWGIRSGNAGLTALIELGGGTLGASADWTSALNMTLTGTNGNVVIDTLDSADATTARTITLGGVLSGTGGLTKTGAGILALTGAAGAGTFTGTATVNGGTLVVNAGAAAAGTLQTAPGGTLRPGTITGVGVANVAKLTLGGGSADFRIGASTDKLVVSGAFAVDAPTAIRALPANAITAPFPQLFDVIDYTGTIGGTSGLAGLTFGSSNPHLEGELVNDETNTVVQVKITKADTVTWKGNVSGNWDVNTTSNWVLGSDGVTTSKYYDFDVVKFDDLGIGQPTVSLLGAITPATLAVENTSGTYTFQGSGIGGGTGLIKTGAGGLTMLTNNTFTGVVDIQGGRVEIGNGGPTGVLGGTGGIPLATGASLVFNTSTAALLPASRPLSGGGAVEQNGTGSLELQGTHSFSGGLTINAGSVILSSGGGDAGVISGVVTVNGGTLSATAGNAFGYGGNRIYTLNVNGGTVTTSANGDQGWAIAVNLTSGTMASTGPGYYSLGGGSAVNYQGFASPATFSGNIRLRENNPNNMLPFTVADGAAAVDLSVSGSLSLGGGISKAGPGTMDLSGANTFTGPIGVFEGTLSFTRPVHTVIPNALTGTGGTIQHNSPQELILSGDGSSYGGTIDANGKVVRLAGATSGSGTGGTLALEGGSLNLGLNAEGLLFYGTFAGAAMVTTPLTAPVLSDSAAGLHSVIPGDTTIAYDGEIYLTAGEWSFGENVDDAVYVVIGGTTLINDNTWNVATSGTFNAPADGWYTMTLRVQNGGGGAGPVDAWATAGIGIGIKKGGASTVLADYTRFEIGALGTKCRAAMAAGANTMSGGLALGGDVPNTVDTGVGSLAINGVVTGGASSSLVKNGTGTLSLNAVNTYTGATVVNAGILAVNGTSLADGNKVVLNGGMIELTGTETIGTLFYGDAAQATGTTYGSTASEAAVKDDSRFSGTGMLMVAGGTAGFGSWISGFGLAAGDQDPTDDPDNDGLDNALEWVLGGNPASTMDSKKLPTVSTSGGNLVFTFKRTQASKVVGTAVAIQVGTSLITWPTSYTVGNDTAGSTAGVTITDNGDGTDTVVLTVAQAPDAAKFARLAVTIN